MNKLLKLSFIKRWPLCCLLFCVMSCHQQKEKEIFTTSKNDSLVEEQKAIAAFERINYAKDIVISGDLILRTGKDFTSDVMRRLSQKDKTYSHCGIAEWENDTLFVYHALGGEFNPDQRLRRDPFSFFCNPYENRGFGIFRYTLNGQQQKNISNTVHQFYRDEIMFDMKFDLATNDRMYCSEFVYKTMEKATEDSIELSTTTLNHIKFVAIDNLFINAFCKEIKRVVFSRQ